MFAPPGAAGIGPLQPYPPDPLSSAQVTPSGAVNAYQAPSWTEYSEGFSGGKALMLGIEGGSAAAMQGKPKTVAPARPSTPIRILFSTVPHPRGWA